MFVQYRKLERHCFILLACITKKVILTFWRKHSADITCDKTKSTQTQFKKAIWLRVRRIQWRHLRCLRQTGLRYWSKIHTELFDKSKCWNNFLYLSLSLCNWKCSLSHAILPNYKIKQYGGDYRFEVIQ